MIGVLSQRINGNDHAIAFYSKHLGSHELKLPAHEKELLAIKTALENGVPTSTEDTFQSIQTILRAGGCSTIPRCLQRWLVC